MSRGYRAYITVHGDDGQRLGKVGLAPVVQNLNAHAREAEDSGWRIGYDPFRVASHLGKTVILLDVEQAWEVRLAYRAARDFLNRTGWRWSRYLNANTQRAL